MARIAALLLALLILLVGAGAALAQDFPPRPGGPVYDGANIIDPAAEQALVQRLTQYNRQTGRAIVVATVPTLEGLPVDSYAQQLAERWDVGGAETEEGVVMVVAPNERDAWITTARGVQTTLTDAMAGRIFRDAMVPRFRQGDYPGGIAAGIEGIIQTLDMDPAQAAAIAEAEAAAASSRGRQGGSSFLGVIFWIAMIGGFMLIFGRGRRGRRHRRYGAGSMARDVILWSAVGSMIGRSHRTSGGFGRFGGGGGFGGFGGGGGGFNGGGAGGSW
jgi:uncharacterized protein